MISMELAVPSSDTRPTNELAIAPEKMEESTNVATIAPILTRIKLLGNIKRPSFNRAINHRKNANTTVIEIKPVFAISREILNPPGRKKIGNKNMLRKISINAIVSSFVSDFFVVGSGVLLVIFIIKNKELPYIVYLL